MSLHEDAATRQRTTPNGSAVDIGAVVAPHRHDRATVAELLEQYEALVDANGSDDWKQALAERICAMLASREGCEAEPFDPVACAAPDAHPRADAGECTPATAQELIERIRAMEADDARTARRSLDGVGA